MIKVTGLACLNLVGLLYIGVMGKEVYNTQLRDDPETYEGFEDLQREGYQPMAYVGLSERADVTHIAMLPGKDYRIVTLDDRTIGVIGEFGYNIRPERRFAPKDCVHSDFFGSSPCADGKAYWTNRRGNGSVFLKNR